MNAAIFIALERYADPSFREVKYAEADARSLAAVLGQHGFAPSACEMLINEQATKTSIESVVRTTLHRLTPDDTLYVFIAGQGLVKPGEGRFLTCYDTRRDDAEHTSIRLEGLLQQLQGAKCQRIVVFLDVCRDADLADGSHVVDLEANFGICFASCRADETSHRSTTLKHGIWAYHLIQAFDGQAKRALDGNRLTAASLQKYLQTAIPATLRETDPAAIQTPQYYGPADQDVQLADLADVFAARDAAKRPTAEQVKDAILLKETSVSAKQLSGFNKSLGHALPDRRSHFAQAFLVSIAGGDIEADVEQVRVALKEAFGFTRRQLTTATYDGAATITTPHFNYNVSIEQDAAEPANVKWRRSVDAIVDPDRVLSEAFETVFARTFDTVELSLEGAVDIEGLIDYIESMASDEVQVDYGEDEHVTSCRVRIQGHNAAIKVTKNTFSVRLPHAASPKLLVKSFFDIQRALTQEHHVSMIPFETK